MSHSSDKAEVHTQDIESKPYTVYHSRTDRGKESWGTAKAATSTFHCFRASRLLERRTGREKRKGSLL